MNAILVLALMLLPAASPATAPELWLTRADGDPRWSRVDIRGTWSEQGRQGYDGTVWYRRAIPPAANDAGLLLGPPAYGGYEVYADGKPIGRSRGWSSALAFGYGEAFRLPPGTTTLELRVRRIAWVSDADPAAAPTGGVATIGAYPALAARNEASWSRNLLREVPLLALALLFACVAVSHLLRLKQREHLWFALLALAFAVNTFASTYWIYELTASRALAARLADASGHLAAVFAIQFLWTFFARRASRPLRAYQLSHLALAAFVALWPDIRVVFLSGTVRWLWLLPLLVIAAALVLRQTWRGDADARVVAAGGAVMILIQAAELARNVLAPAWWPFDFSIAAFGFAAAMVAMGLALSLRFRRVHEELDRLRSHLEAQVEERTRDLAVARDEALAAYRTKGEFLANISHEIRTPMNGVIGMAELLACTPLTPEQERQVRAIEASGRSLLALLNDVLDFSRLEAKGLTVEQRPFLLANVVEDCLEIMAPLAAGKGLTLVSTVAPDTVDAICGDQYRTRQVLLNLVSNAIKFTFRGRVEVALSSHPLDDGRVEVRFAVSDTGSGIAGEDVDRLFVAFQQLDGSASRPHGGAGLGLAISKRLTELMGGSMTLDTAAGRGSTFHFTIIGDPAPANWTLPAPPARQAVPSTRSSMRILLAEDDAVNQVVTVGMLQHLGYQAELAVSGEEALDALERVPYDVVLMDVQMPGMDGLEVASRIRARGGHQPYIVALTAHALAGDRERCLAAGMNDYLSKPISLTALQNALAGASAAA